MKHKTIAITLTLILSIFLLIDPAFAAIQKKGIMWIDEDTGIVVINTLHRQLY